MAGLQVWRMAKLDEFFEAHLTRGDEDIPWSTMAKILTVARFCEPSSELHIAEDCARRLWPTFSASMSFPEIYILQSGVAVGDEL